MNENTNDTLDQQWRVKSFTMPKFLHTNRDYFGISINLLTALKTISSGKRWGQS